MKLACDITVMGGTFASQPLAFAHILDAAQTQGRSLDLDHVEVLQAPHAGRLSQWFDPDTCARITELAPQTLVVFLPGSSGPLAPTALLTPVGVFLGTLTRAPLPRD